MYQIEGDRVSCFLRNLFRRPQLMPEADAATFEPVGEWWAKDREHVFFLHRVIPEAEPSSFVVLGGINDIWARDRRLAFYFWPTRSAKRFRILRSASVDQFHILGRGFPEYALDSERVYYRGRWVRSADAETFRGLLADRMGEADSPSYHFARDASRVYFNGRPIPGAHLESFRVVHAPGLGNHEYGVDTSHAYCQNWVNGKMSVTTHDQLPLNLRSYLFGNPP